MRVLLVTWADQLLEKISILSPELEYCAIVTDEVEVAKEILEQNNLPKIPLYPFYDMKECLKDFYYDYVLCVENQWWQSLLANKVQKYDVPKEKILNFCGLTFSNNFHIEIALRYYKEHAAEFEMFATGISYTEHSLDVTKFKRKLFNFARASQDLYYNFQVAKFVVLYGGGMESFVMRLSVWLRILSITIYQKR